MHQAAITDRSPYSPPYQRHRPEQTLLYQIIERHYPEFRDVMAMQGKSLPLHVQQEFDDYLKCGRLEHGFLRVQCTHCHHEYLVAFSCKRRGFCPSCDARRMAESAALLVDEVLPERPIRQWVLSFPFQLPNSKYRVDVTPAKRCKGRSHQENEDKTPAQRHRAMTWAQRLKRVFNIDVSVCPKCGGEAKVIASIEDQAVIDKIPVYLMKKGALPPPPELLPATRASPDSDWFA